MTRLPSDLLQIEREPVRKSVPVRLAAFCPSSSFARAAELRERERSRDAERTAPRFRATA
jgi:hypothetical protein